MKNVKNEKAKKALIAKLMAEKAKSQIRLGHCDADCSSSF